MSAATKPKLGYDELWALGDDTRHELIHGEIAMPKRTHGGVGASLAGWVVRRFNRQHPSRWPGGWEIFTELHVVYGAHEIYCHDLAGYHRGRMDVDEPGWTRIQPNWVCEVLSPKHEKRDLVDKLATLQRVGVAHYWIVDATARILQVYRHEPRGYLLVASAGSGETIRAEPFDAVELRTAVIFGDDDDDD